MLCCFKRTAPAFLFGMVLASLLSCEETEVVNPDLKYQYANLEKEVVDSGEPLVLQSSITNEMEICPDCTTSDAASNDRSIRVMYRPDTVSPWVDAQLADEDGNIVFELVKPVPEIKAGQKHIKTDGFIFSNPGFYQYFLLADRSNLVSERDEENNDASSKEGDVRASATPGKFQLKVRVFDPTGKIPPVYDNKPVIVQYVEHE